MDEEELTPLDEVDEQQLSGLAGVLARALADHREFVAPVCMSRREFDSRWFCFAFIDLFIGFADCMAKQPHFISTYEFHFSVRCFILEGRVRVAPSRGLEFGSMHRYSTLHEK